MDEELKPCPFCGKPGDKWLAGAGKLIRCGNHECALANLYVDVSDWNQRPVEDALRAALVNLATEVERSRDPLRPLSKLYDAVNLARATLREIE